MFVSINVRYSHQPYGLLLGVLLNFLQPGVELAMPVDEVSIWVAPCATPRMRALAKMGLRDISWVPWSGMQGCDEIVKI